MAKTFQRQTGGQRPAQCGGQDRCHPFCGNQKVRLIGDRALDEIEKPGRNDSARNQSMGIGLSTLTRWLGQERNANQPSEAPLDLHAKLKRLRRENAVLKQERGILKKAATFFAQEGSR